MGNTRVIFADDGTGTPTILQEADYYPFGMRHDRSVTATNHYLYNGKELNTDLGLDWYDYGARWLDVETGRWSTIDPLAESYASMSPFNYVANNPISNIDPDGKRFKVSIKNEGNGNISINISSTIYIQTDNPSEWEVIIKDAKEYFLEVFKKNQSSDGKVLITFDVNFKASSITKDELGEGDNLLKYNPKKKSRVNPSEDYDRQKMGITGVLGHKDYRTIVHETGHFLGLVDRYTNVNKRSVTHEGWKGNLMGDSGPNLFQSQYDNFARHLLEHYNKTNESNFIYEKYVDLKGWFPYPPSKIKKNE